MKIESLARSLAEHPFLASLPPDGVDFLAGCTKNMRFSEGEYLFREGCAADYLYLLREGNVTLESHVPGKGAVVLERFEPGESLGATVLIGPHVWHVDARAASGVLAFAVEGACLRRKLEDDPRFGYAVARHMLQSVHGRLSRARLQQLDVYNAERTKST